MTLSFGKRGLGGNRRGPERPVPAHRPRDERERKRIYLCAIRKHRTWARRTHLYQDWGRHRSISQRDATPCHLASILATRVWTRASCAAQKARLACGVPRR